jgi:hypothetical protein
MQQSNESSSSTDILNPVKIRMLQLVRAKNTAKHKTTYIENMFLMRRPQLEAISVVVMRSSSTQLRPLICSST